MKKYKKVLAYLMIVLLLLPNMTVTTTAEAKNNWDFRAFGSNTSEEKNPEPSFHDDGAITIEANGGKISSSVDGISYYYQTLSSDTNFEIHAEAEVESFGANNQVSFGLMLRDEVGSHWDSSGHEANYVAVGGLDQAVKGFYKDGSQAKLDPFMTTIPSTGDVYNLKIKKSGSTYVVSVNGIESQPMTLDNIFSDEIFVGVYAARDTTVTFRNVAIEVDDRTVESLNVDASDMKTKYLQGEKLDTTGLNVSATYSDGTTEVLSENDYITTGFDSSMLGTNLVTIHYNGVTANLELEIAALTVTDLSIKYLPAKTEYYKGDYFDPSGFVVEATYNEGFETAVLTEDQYTFQIEGKTVDEGGFTFETAGTIPVTVVSKETPEQTAVFHVTVNGAELTALEIRRLPAKTVYFLGDELNLAGMSVYAVYSDDTEIRLLSGDYEVSGFDSETAGEKEITLTHKGKTASFPVEVKVKEVEGIEVTTYPKTTYEVGEDFDATGLEISKTFSNGETESLKSEEYEIDASKFSTEKPGVYPIKVIPEDNELEPITFDVTVREAKEVEWKQIRFGQSSSSDKNYIEKLDDGTIKLIAEEGGGKVTGDHDGITFYYTEIDAEEDNFVLSADIHVLEYAKTPHDGQEGFGIMARDAIGPADDSGVFASNIAAVGGFSGGTREENGTQLFVRTGVLSSDGEGSQGIQKKMLKNERPNAENTAENYRLTLEKTNSGFIGKLNDGEEEIIYEPEILNVQDGKMYVGFFTARLATIEVSNIDFSVSAAETDAPRVYPPKEPIEPKLDIVSLDKTSETAYPLRLKANVDGVVTVKEDGEVVAREVAVTAGELVEMMTEIDANEQTNFSVTFLPDDTQLLTDYSPIVKNFTVDMKTYADDGDIFVAPDGSSKGDGTKENPLDLDTAIDFVMPGQKIIVQEGHYIRNAPLEIKQYNDGTEENRKYLIADPAAEERPLIDFDKKSEGVVHSGNYWHVEGIDFARSAGNTKGYTIGGSYNEIVNISTFEHGDTGLQISRTDASEDNKANWPSYNLILNSISYDNQDPAENNADGFAAKLTSGEGNVFHGTIAFNNIDDGWDLYTKVGTGAIGAVTIEKSIAFNNGTLTNGYEGSGDKNGFKLGGEGVHVPHVIKNSLAFGNGSYGFTSNSNPGVDALDNISFDNGGANADFSTYSHIEPDFTIDAFASIRTTGHVKDSYPAENAADVNFFFNGEESVNASGERLPTNTLLQSLEQLFHFDEDGNIVSVKRDEDGNILWGNLWETFDDIIQNDSESDNEEEGNDSEENEDPVSEDEKENIIPEENDKEDPQQEGTDENQGSEVKEEEVTEEAKEKSSIVEDTRSDTEGHSAEKLPVTATAMYSFILIGSLALLLGVAVRFSTIQRKQE